MKYRGGKNPMLELEGPHTKEKYNDGVKAARRATIMGYKITRGKPIFNGRGYTYDPNGWGISGHGIKLENVNVDDLADKINYFWESRG